MPRRAVIVLLGLAGMLAGGCVRYQPRPLDPTRHPAELRARRLDDPAMIARVTPFAGAPGEDRWSDRQLAVAALGQRAVLDRARAEWHAALAAVRTAGARPRPGLETGVERRVSGRREGSPWVVSLNALLTVELGGQRGARLLAARARAAGAESRLLALAWDVVGETRRASADLAGAGAEVGQRRREVAALERVAELERGRYAEAALPSAELARTATEVQDARAALARAEAGVLTARAALAAALAVPVATLDGVETAAVPTAGCAWLDSAGVIAVGDTALARRHEVTAALADYTAAEAGLRLEVARQLPDLELSPGFIWDQGVHRWTLALALPALLGHRNRGPIAEADVARTVAIRAVESVQDSVIADIESAAQECRGARLALTAGDSLMAAAAGSVERARAAYRRGETTTLEPARAELQLLRAERVRSDAARRLELSGIALESAAGEWRDASGASWPDPRNDPGQEATAR